MITKKISEISLVDIQDLIDLKIPEGKTIEYKQELKISSDSDKREFLADLSSFANTGGGDLIFGLQGSKGLAIAITPLKIPDLDAEKLKIEQIVRVGLDPKISLVIHSIPTGTSDEYIILIRISESLNKPHRVIHSGSQKFYARNSSGKYELDVEELRQVFNLAPSLLEKITNFRLDRTVQIESASSIPLINNEEGKLIIHVIPVESFSHKTSVSMKDLADVFINRTKLNPAAHNFSPIRAGGWSHRITANGIMSYEGTQNGISGYVELYKNGIIEIVKCGTVHMSETRKFLPMRAWELEILNYLPKIFELQKVFDIQTPSYIFITFTGVRNCIIKRGEYYNEEEPLSKDQLYLPEAIIYDYAEDDLSKTLKPSFDFVWNSGGIVQSPNYDNNGNLIT